MPEVEIGEAEIGNKEEGKVSFVKNFQGVGHITGGSPEGSGGHSSLEKSCSWPFLAAGLATKGPFLPSQGDPHYLPSSEAFSS